MFNIEKKDFLHIIYETNFRCPLIFAYIFQKPKIQKFKSPKLFLALIKFSMPAMFFLITELAQSKVIKPLQTLIKHFNLRDIFSLYLYLV